MTTPGVYCPKCGRYLGAYTSGEGAWTHCGISLEVKPPRRGKEISSTPELRYGIPYYAVIDPDDAT